MSLTSVHPTHKTMNANVAVVLKEFLLIVSIQTDSLILFLCSKPPATSCECTSVSDYPPGKHPVTKYPDPY